MPARGHPSLTRDRSAAPRGQLLIVDIDPHEFPMPRLTPSRQGR